MRRDPVVSQPDNAGTVTSGDVAGQALAGDEADNAARVDPGLDHDADAADVTGDEPAAPAGDEAAEDEVAGDEAAGDEAAGEEAPAGPAADPAALEQESEIAADYVEGLLDVADLDGDIDMDVEGDRAVVSVVGATLEELIGPRGEVLEALQELTRLAVHRQTGNRTRIMLDVGGYRARRRTELTELGRDAAEEVRSSGVPRRLSAMTPFERKVVHDAVASAGLRSESEGEEPNRRVVVFPVG
jgi:spoIIIJ-associated protein